MRKFGWPAGPIWKFARYCRHEPRLRRQRLALQAMTGNPVKKIVIGSSGTAFDGWVSTDREVIDLLREATWSAYFNTGSLDAILAEHVWEHLSSADATRAAHNCYRFLKAGGYLRVAVPDGYHPDPSYIEEVRPGGSGSGAGDHKLLYNFESFAAVFTEVGFDVCLYEYFDSGRQFQSREWDTARGMVQRSARFDSRNSTNRLAYTSIILDAIKPTGGSI